MVQHAHSRPARAPGAGMARLRPDLVHAGSTPVALGAVTPIPPPAEAGGDSMDQGMVAVAAGQVAVWPAAIAALVSSNPVT